MSKQRLKSEPDRELTDELEAIAGEVTTTTVASEHLGRVRWVGVSVERPRVGWMEAEVELEWAGKRYTGRAEGESGLVSGLRVVGLASTRALEAILDGAVTYSFVGIKSIRVFDHDLVAVLLHSPQAPDRHLVGVSLVTDDVHRSASVAVLNATNRLLGNYLATSD